MQLAENKGFSDGLFLGNLNKTGNDRHKLHFRFPSTRGSTKKKAPRVSREPLVSGHRICMDPSEGYKKCKLLRWGLFLFQLGAHQPFIKDKVAYGKKSLSIDLKHKEGLSVIKQLANKSDVILEPFRKGKGFTFWTRHFFNSYTSS